MMDTDGLAAQFEDHRGHLRTVAYRMLGSASEADDAVQETWLRLGRVDASEVRNLGGWLTTVVSRVCLDLLRARSSRREDALDIAAVGDQAGLGGVAAADPEQEAVEGEAVGAALGVVLDTLAPEERLAFGLHDVFAVPFAEIAPIVGRTPAAARQLASRGRRRVQATSPEPPADHDRQRAIVDAFRAASRDGEFYTLLAMLDPNVVLRVDGAARQMGAGEMLGATAVAEYFKGRAQAAQVAMINGAPGLLVAPGGERLLALGFTLIHGKIAAIEVIANPDRLGKVESSPPAAG